jgi:hypothetical protein
VVYDCAVGGTLTDWLAASPVGVAAPTLEKAEESVGTKLSSHAIEEMELLTVLASVSVLSPVTS